MQFLSIIDLLNATPELRPTLRKKEASNGVGAAFVDALARQFVESRTPRPPKVPQTLPDAVVGLILNGYYRVAPTRIREISDTHLLSMASENIVGDVLERYIASVLEPVGWVWCSGSSVKSVDFYRPKQSCASPLLLQVKNRDNSENSSSSAIRNGTTIEKWFRSFSRRAATNWGAFPDPAGQKLLSEEGFCDFVKRYIAGLPPKA